MQNLWALAKSFFMLSILTLLIASKRFPAARSFQWHFLIPVVKFFSCSLKNLNLSAEPENGRFCLTK